MNSKRYRLVILITIIAIFLKSFPEIVLHVPKIGFLLYSIVKGAPIPAYIVKDMHKNDSAWLRPNDVIAAVAAKSGTTWMMATLHAIRTKGKML